MQEGDAIGPVESTTKIEIDLSEQQEEALLRDEEPMQVGPSEEAQETSQGQQLSDNKNQQAGGGSDVSLRTDFIEPGKLSILEGISSLTSSIRAQVSASSQVTDDQQSQQPSSSKAIQNLEEILQKSSPNKPITDQSSRQRFNNRTRNRPNNRQKNNNWLNDMRSPVQILNEMFAKRSQAEQPRFVENGVWGPPHDRTFAVKVTADGKVFDGRGKSKQMARQVAAQNAVKCLINTWQRQPQYKQPLLPDPSFGPGFSQNGPRFNQDQFNAPAPRRVLDYDHSSPSVTPMRVRVPKGQEGPRFSNRFPSGGQAIYRGHHERYHPYKRDEAYFSNDFPNVPSPNITPPNIAPNVYPQHKQVMDYQHRNPNHKSKQSSQWTSPSQGPSFSKDDFTVDDIENADFIEFNRLPKEQPKKGDNQMEQDLEPEVRLNQKKERIILRVMSETPVSENPISVIHELNPDLKWEFVGSDKEKSMRQFEEFKMKLSIANESFIGAGRTKKLAKLSAASKALEQLYNIIINNEPCNTVNTQHWAPKTVVEIREDLLLKQELANRIGIAVYNRCNEVLETLNELNRWNVMAAMVLTNDLDDKWLDVVCVTTGTKCIKGDSLSMLGCAVNDCHAEVLARRCFLRFIYKQIDLLILNDYADEPELVIERREDGFGFRMKKQFKVHLFISTAPCGDARVFSPKEENVSDNHPNRMSRGLLRAKIECGEGTIPVRREAALLTWDGILQGSQRLQFMSCSDKIAVWNVVGLQGALLSHLIEPIYLESIVLGSLFNYEHFVRAIHGRLNLNFDSNTLRGLPKTYQVNYCKVAKLQNDPNRQVVKTPTYAINWLKDDDKPEVIACDSGKTHTDNFVSRLCKRSMFAQFCSILARNCPTLPSSTFGKIIPTIYRDGKTASQDYQRAKYQVMQTFQEQNLGNWIQVPSEIDLFGLQV